MDILKEIRKEKITTNWFMIGDTWYKFVSDDLFFQDKEKTGPDSIVQITDNEQYNKVFVYYKAKR